ncbi:MAG: serine hydrolase [Beijerinckiaceae bacterium]|nr:serine hydrolase [Beijerinckiaceae bacterium]
MVELPPEKFRLIRRAVLRGLSLTVLLSASALGPAEAHRGHHHGRAVLAHRIIFRVRHTAHMHAPLHVRPGSYNPPFSAYAVDGNSGRVLYGRDENEQRHPASLTKVMTLYLLFEQLEKKRLTLDSELTVSQHAASQEPTKLGLRPGSTIRVEDAIKAIVTKSANDMAVAVAERIGGDEDNFARLMTRKAHMLGMSRTLYRNASGLPNDEQLTTAKDLVTLGRAIHDHFPGYYRFFATPSFRYAGQFMPNHNHLMERVEGMDGIKTGYTRASGFNLLTSVNRNGHYLVSVVVGGKTRLGRDRIMSDMIESLLDKCATVRTASAIEENPALEQVAEAIPVVQHTGEAAPEVQAVNEDDAEEQSSPASAKVKPEPIKTVPAAVQIASVSGDSASTRARPAYVPGMPSDRMATGSIKPRENADDGSTSHVTGDATLSRRALREAAKQAKDGAKNAPVKVAKAEPEHAEEPARPAIAHEGWMIQIGATDNLEKANELLSRAKGQSQGTLGGAKPFTEKVQKGQATLYRARFAGLEANSAEKACKALKHSGFACFATKN